MSKFVGIVRDHWKQHRPEEFQAATPEFFETLGQEIEDQVQTLAASIAGPDRPDEDYLEKVARLTTARQNAESDVLREMLSPSTSASGLDDEDLQEQIRQAHNDQVNDQALLEARAWAIVEQEHHDTPEAEQRAFQSALTVATRSWELEKADRVA